MSHWERLIEVVPDMDDPNIRLSSIVLTSMEYNVIKEFVRSFRPKTDGHPSGCLCYECCQ